MRLLPKRPAAVLLSALLCLCLLSGCEKKEFVITTAFAGNEIMRIDSRSCFLPEMMLYLTNMQNMYENVYGSSIWEQEVPDEPLSERIRDMALAKIAQVKVMDLMAEEYGLTLDEEDEKRIETAADDYYNGLNETERLLIGVGYEDVKEAYREICLAGKVYNHLIRDINPEISDDEARIVTVWHILIRDHGEGGMAYGERGMRESREAAEEALRLIESGEESFEAVAAKYSEDPELSYTFGRGEMPEAIENAAFSLDRNAVSPIIETDTGFHILKCVSDFDVEMTQLNKESILKNERRRAFDETYEAFLPGLTKTLNRKLLDSIELIHDPEVTTDSFFNVVFD